MAGLKNGSASRSIYYYPFGMNMEGNWAQQIGPNNKYQYNGKELNDDFGLNWLAFEARWYDPAIGRFVGSDPIAEKFAWVSPYNYAENDPIAHIDLWGLQKAKPKKEYRFERQADMGPVLNAIEDAVLYGMNKTGDGINWVVDKVSNLVSGESEKESGGDVAGMAENGGDQETRTNSDANIVELDELTNGATPKHKTIAPSGLVRAGTAAGTEVYKALSGELEEESKSAKTSPSQDSVICPTCENLQDSSHIDRINGSGTFEKVKENDDEK